MADEPRASDRRRPKTKAEIPTPALIVDLAPFEANVAKMAEHCRGAGVKFRPHAKTHKCPEIARRQVQAGAVGACAATVPEADRAGGASWPDSEWPPVNIASAVSVAAARMTPTTRLPGRKKPPGNSGHAAETDSHLRTCMRRPLCT